LGQGFLRTVDDAVLAEMLRGLGVEVTKVEAPFEPEPGAYGAGLAHSSEDAPIEGGRIHEYKSANPDMDPEGGEQDRSSPRSQK
jgi:hypothetical protein